MELEDTITFHQSDLQSTAFDAFEEMRKRGQLCDVIIKVENCSFAAHRVILAAAIPYFQSELTSDSKTNGKTEMSVGDVEPGALESLLHFAYTNRVTISIENVKPLLFASQFLQLNQVLGACVQFLSERLRVDSVIQVRTFALNLSNSDLIESSENYILQNFEEFSQTSDFLQLPFSYVKEIISKDELNVSNEETVFEAALQWVKHSPEERNGMLPELLREVRMIYFSSDYLTERVDSEELINSSTACKDMIDEVKNYHLSKTSSFFSTPSALPRKKGDCNYATRSSTAGKSSGEYENQDLYAVCCSPTDELTVSHYCSGDMTWRALSSSKKKEYFSHVVTVNEKIYIFLRNRILTFHVRTLTWERLKPRHEDMDNSAIVSHESMIYCFGSLQEENRDKIRCFNTEWNKWAKEKAMRSARAYLAAATLGEFIYLTGGLVSLIGSSLSSVEKYNPTTGEWGEAAPLLTPRCCHSCTSSTGRLYVAGGSSGEGSLHTAEMYDSLTNQWNWISSMKTRRCMFSLKFYDGHVYAVGGETVVPGAVSEVDVYDTCSDEWKFGPRLPNEFKKAELVCVSRN